MTTAELEQAAATRQRVWLISLDGVHRIAPREGFGQNHGGHRRPGFWSKEKKRTIYAFECFATELEAWQDLLAQTEKWREALRHDVARMEGERAKAEDLASLLPGAKARILWPDGESRPPRLTHTRPGSASGVRPTSSGKVAESFGDGAPRRRTPNGCCTAAPRSGSARSWARSDGTRTPAT